MHMETLAGPVGDTQGTCEVVSLVEHRSSGFRQLWREVIYQMKATEQHDPGYSQLWLTLATVQLMLSAAVQPCKVVHRIYRVHAAWCYDGAQHNPISMLAHSNPHLGTSQSQSTSVKVKKRNVSEPTDWGCRVA